MIESLEVLKQGHNNLKEIGAGKYYKSVPEEAEQKLFEKFIEYKRNTTNAPTD